MKMIPGYTGLAAVWWLALGCGQQEPAAPPAVQPPTAVAVATETPPPTPPLALELPVTVEPLQKVDLCARVPGVIKELAADVDIGRRVHAGEKLIELHVPELEAQQQHRQALLRQTEQQALLADEAVRVAQSEVVEAEKQERRFIADFEYARAQHRRVAEMVRRNSVAPEVEQEKLRALQSAEAAWEMAQAQIATKKAKLAAAQADQQVARSKVEVARAEADHVRQLIELATIRAPFHGIISRRWVDRGATVKDAGMPLLTVINIEQVRVLLEVPEAEVSRIGELVEPKGAASPRLIELRFSALSGQPGGGVFQGSIARISGTLDPTSRTMRAEIILDNSGGQLRPGMRGCALLREEPTPQVPILRTSRSR